MDEKFTKRFESFVNSLDSLKVRNQLAHDHDGEIVKSYCHTIVNIYIDKIYEFKNYVDKVLGQENQ